ncbi:MAG: hypothetical protein MUP44_00585, partial [Anaerolineales bacterium]|nr:hypothetical protein [Anaerolineales bacterium]
MAFGTDPGGKEMEGSGGMPFDIMNTVAVDTRGYIGVAFADESLTVNAFCIEVENFGVAAFTGLRDLGSGLIGIADVMRTMAIGAYRRSLIASGKGFLMNTVQRGIIL